MQIPNAILIPEIIRLLDEGHTVTLRLRGYSMRPFLEDDRDVALLVKAETVKVGDPVLAEVSPRHYVFHRIVAIEGEAVTLRGDGNLPTEGREGGGHRILPQRTEDDGPHGRLEMEGV